MRMKANLNLKFVIILMSSLLTSAPSHAYEMLGLISYNFSQVSPLPSSYSKSSNGIGYTFLGRMDLGPGQLESGFQFIPVSITTNQTFEVTTSGSYWIIPLMYRYSFFPPFFSLGVGFDYAVVGTNNVITKGTQVSGLNSGYRPHFGAQVSVQTTQDLGEDLSAVLDLRYRTGLAPAINYGTESSKYNFWIIALGIQKHLE